MKINSSNIIVVAALIRSGMVSLKQVRGTQKNKDRLLLILKTR
jgi:hypothetical protein